MPPIVKLYHANALAKLPSLARDSVDVLLVDPPYSSGGMFRSDKAADPVKKYEQHNTQAARPSFSGDNRDTRSWLAWSVLWLQECLPIVRERGYVFLFTDWRQLPTATDALQAAGFIWRGIIPWNKGRGSRAPHKGYFRHQCEYVLWGTRGPTTIATHDGPYDGCLHFPVKPAEKFHLCGKPPEMLRELLRCAPAGSTVLDPMMGSGSTALAALALDQHFVGIESDAHYFRVARDRIKTYLRARPRAAA